MGRYDRPERLRFAMEQRQKVAVRRGIHHGVEEGCMVKGNPAKVFPRDGDLPHNKIG